MNINILSLINTCVVNTGTKISVLKKCRLKLNRSIQFEMLFIKDKKLTLNIQSDPLKQTFLFDISSAPRLVFSFIIYWLFFSLNRMYWDCHTYIHFIITHIMCYLNLTIMKWSVETSLLISLVFILNCLSKILTCLNNRGIICKLKKKNRRGIRLQSSVRSRLKIDQIRVGIFTFQPAPAIRCDWLKKDPLQKLEYSMAFRIWMRILLHL